MSHPKVLCSCRYWTLTGVNFCISERFHVYELRQRWLVSQLGGRRWTGFAASRFPASYDKQPETETEDTSETYVTSSSCLCWDTSAATWLVQAGKLSVNGQLSLRRADKRRRCWWRMTWKTWSPVGATRTAELGPSHGLTSQVSSLCPQVKSSQEHSKVSSQVSSQHKQVLSQIMSWDR